MYQLVRRRKVSCDDTDHVAERLIAFYLRVVHRKRDDMATLGRQQGPVSVDSPEFRVQFEPFHVNRTGDRAAVAVPDQGLHERLVTIRRTN